jgi:3-oxoacyl-[acyl-carrier-protein] synthase II
MKNENEPIVITGAGLVTALGLSREATWQSILQGRCGIGPLTAVESILPQERDGGQAPDLPADFAPQLPREARYLKLAIDEALRHAGIDLSLPYPTRRRACLLGTTLHGMRAAGRFFRNHDFGEFRDFSASSTLAAATQGAGLGGMASTTCSACSSSLGSIALAITLLQSGELDLVVTGGYDTISEYVYGGFNSLRLIAEGPLRPFTRNRQGMKLAEGYGIVVLERAGDAMRRHAAPLATVLGWGESADAHHLTQPHPQGEGAARAVDQAIRSARLTPADIDLIAAHATGTPDNDAAEYAAFSTVFGDRLSQVPVVAFKSYLGHTLGGAGAVELTLSALALRDQVIPGCVNVSAEDVEFPNLRLALGLPQQAALRFTLNTSLGFGGANTCVILGPAPKMPATRVVPQSPPRREVFITGIGVILPGIVGNDALVAHLNRGQRLVALPDAGPIPESAMEGLLNARRVRRMSDYVKLTLAATTLACRDAGIVDTVEFCRDCAAILGTTHGSSNYSVSYYTQIVKEGILAANPMLFAEAVPNGGAAQLSLMLSLKGACQTVIGTRTAGLDAIALASARIRSGDWDRAIIGAGEEYCDVVCDAYRHCGIAAAGEAFPFGDQIGCVIGAGAATFILESQESMQQRGGKPRGQIRQTAAASGSRQQTIESVADVLKRLGDPAHIITSANGTWIDRAESAAIRRSISGGGGDRVVSSIYGHIAETFSVSPLVAITATLLSRKMPRFLASDCEGGGIHTATGDENADNFAAICTDFSGSVSGLCVANC